MGISNYSLSSAQPFELPPSSNTVIDFVNKLGYPKPVEIGKTTLAEADKNPEHPSLKNPKKKVTPLLIPYRRFSKVIIYYLASNNNIHRRPDSAVYHTGDDFILGNLKFVPKGESVEVFGMAIPDPLITEAIQQYSYYPKYLEMVAENTKKTPQESASVQPATKRATPKKPTTTTPVKQFKPAPAPTKKPSKHKLPQKVRKGKPTFQLVDKDDETQQESVPQEEGDDPDLELAKKMSSEAHQEKGEGEGDDDDMERAIKLSLDPAFLPQDDTSEKVIHESSSTSDSERTESETESAAPKCDKDQDEVDMSTVSSGVRIPISDPEKAHEALARPDPKPMKEDQTGSDSGKLHVSLAGPNPDHMDDEFLATAYPKVHENLKLITDEREKSKVREESDSTIPDPSHQTVTSTPLVIAPFTDVSSTKPSSLVTTPPINIEATIITTSLPEITLLSIEDAMDKEVADQGQQREDDPIMPLLVRLTPPKDDWSKFKENPRKSDLFDQESNISEQSSVDILMQDDGNDLPIPESERPATPEPEWTIPPNDFLEPEINWANTYATTLTGKKKLCKADLEGPAFNLVKAFHKNNDFLQYQMDECHKLLTNKVDLNNPEGHQIMRSVYEPLPLGRTHQAGLWHHHWWFLWRKEFYINKHSEPSDREAVRSRMRILSVISVKVFEKYRYNYLRKIILRRADYQEYKISEKDFKNLHPNDFKNLFLLNIQEKLNHLPKTDTSSLHMAINLERPNWDAADYYFKEDYTIVPKPRAVVYRDRNDQRKLMRLNELHKFSDGTLTRVMEKLDHMVKDFHLFEYNKGMKTRKWSEDDKRRSKDFITAIEKRLQIRRIYRSLESFVGGRINSIGFRKRRTVPKDRPCILLYWSYKVGKVRYGYVKYYKKTVKNGQKRTRERMSDQEAKEIKAEAERSCLSLSTV
ncbi:hypothetical protein Tco_0543886 [Tanacetum coccineum]